MTISPALKATMNETPGYQACLLTSVFLFFATAMTVPSGSTIFLLFTFLLGLPLMKVTDRKQWGLMIALALPFAITAIHYLTGFAEKINPLDAPTRFMLAALCLLPLTQLNRRLLSLACYGCVLGAFGVGVWAYLSTHIAEYYWGDGSRATNSFSNPIPFGLISLLLGFISLVLPISPTSSQKQRQILWILKVLAFCAGLTAAYLSASRTTLLALIPLVWIALYGLTNISFKKVIIVYIAIMATITALIISTNNVYYQRVAEGIHELNSEKAEPGTSMGGRVIMWGMAIDVIKQYPLLGVGSGNLKSKKIPMPEPDGNSEKNDQIVHFFGNPHNELLTITVDAGIPGLISGILLYLIPGLFFIRRLRSQDSYTRFAAIAGSMVVIGFFSAGLMDSYFWIVSQTAVYGMSIAVFSAIILSKKQSR